MGVSNRPVQGETILFTGAHILILKNFPSIAIRYTGGFTTDLTTAVGITLVIARLTRGMTITLDATVLVEWVVAI